MVILGLVVLLVGVILVLVGLFATGYDLNDSGRTVVAIFKNDTTPEVVFLLGVASALFVVLGLWLMKAGAKQGWKRRKEHKRLNELSQKLDDVEAERRRDDLSGRDDES